MVTPLVICLWLCGAIIALTWIASMLFREYSWTDRIWSVAPIAYVWIFAAYSDGNPRLILMACLVTAWGVRLTFNFARRGGYRPGGEDYRWAFIRSLIKPWQYQVFNIVFISAYQNALILLMTLPALTVFNAPSGLNSYDVVVAIAFLGALVGESIADQQQWNFHQRKAELLSRGVEVEEPFLRSGLFAYSRHPNYFFEQLQWWIFYLFAIVATSAILHWTIAGAILLTLLFQGSRVFTEYISAKKYPSYADYQKRVSAIVPLPPRG